MNKELIEWLSLNRVPDDLISLVSSRNIFTLNKFVRSTELIQEISGQLKEIPKKKLLKAIKALEEKKSISYFEAKFEKLSLQERINMSKETSDECTDCGDSVMIKAELCLYLTNLKVQFEEEEKCIKRIIDIIYGDSNNLNKMVEEKLMHSKTRHQERANRLLNLITEKENKGGIVKQILFYGSKARNDENCENKTKKQNKVHFADDQDPKEQIKNKAEKLEKERKSGKLY
jgi:hypothetical protein